MMAGMVEVFEYAACAIHRGPGKATYQIVDMHNMTIIKIPVGGHHKEKPQVFDDGDGAYVCNVRGPDRERVDSIGASTSETWCASGLRVLAQRPE